MKKFFLSLFIFSASAGYIAYQYLGGNSASAATPVAVSNKNMLTPSAPSSSLPPPSKPVAVTPPTPVPKPVPVPTPLPPPPAPTPTPAPKPKGQYVDGTYTGTPADAYYGMVQIRATIKGGKLTAVDFLQYPNDRRTSQYINQQAMPLLKEEAIQAQSANVSGVSGASDTSMAFIQSLGDALTQAKNS